VNGAAPRLRPPASIPDTCRNLQGEAVGMQSKPQTIPFWVWRRRFIAMHRRLGFRVGYLDWAAYTARKNELTSPGPLVVSPGGFMELPLNRGSSHEHEETDS
jgi:hypothetical protein